MNIYVSFGSDHKHTVLGKEIGGLKTLAQIPCDNHSQGRALAFALFGEKFCTTHEKDAVDASEFLSRCTIVNPFK